MKDPKSECIVFWIIIYDCHCHQYLSQYVVDIINVMDKKQNIDIIDADFTFSPKISKSSQKIAKHFQSEQGIESISNNELIASNFMRGTRTKQVTLQPMNRAFSPASIETTKKQQNSHHLNDEISVTSSKTYHSNTQILPQLINPTSLGIDNHTDTLTEPRKKHKSKTKELKKDSVSGVKEMSGQPGLDFQVAPTQCLDESVFTFRPKLSTASAKIVENLGSDFMTRQQQHIDRQKKLVSIFV